MTAEIAILNKSAVALAADSAVTIQTTHGQKSYNNGNKLFALTKHHPVGIMIYGSAELNGVPWETIIKLYRQHLGKDSLNYIEDYANDFIQFLKRNLRPILGDGQDAYFEQKVREYIYMLKDEYYDLIDKEIESAKNIKTARAGVILSQLLRRELKIMTSRYRLPEFRNQSGSSIISTRKRLANEIIKSEFQEYPLTASQKSKLLSILGTSFTRYTFTDPQVSGVVIAGFGDNEHYPAMVHHRVEGFIDGKLRQLRHKSIGISTNKEPVVIMPFAQDEMVHMFMEGIDPKLKDTIEEYIGQILNDLPSAIISEIQRSGCVIKKSVTKALKDKAKAILQSVLQNFGEYSRVNHVDPVVFITAILPKDELASMAEALVNLTTFRRRVSMEAETVSGPIDVAVISKGDGFVWIKRKHYFNRELNPEFFNKTR